MKGCLALLVLMVALAGGGYVALLYTPMAGSFGLPILVAVLFTLALTNLWGLAVQVRRTLAHRPPGQWSNGDFVSISGAISAGDQALVAPASGTRCALYEYRLVCDQPGKGRSSERSQAAFNGMAMAPCTVVGGGFGVRLVGFPLLGSVPSEAYDEHEPLRRFAQYLLSAEILPKPESARVALRQLSGILADEDGVLRHDQQSFAAFDLEPFRHAYYADVENDEEAETPDRTEPFDDGMPPEDRLVEHLLYDRYRVFEKVVPEGAAVTAFGTYRSADRALDVGSGLTDVKHGLELGEAGRVATRMIAKSALALVVFAGLFGLLLWKLVPALAPTFRAERYQGEKVHLHELVPAVLMRQPAADLYRRIEGNENEALPFGLLIRAGADPDAPDGAGLTALHRAAERGNVELAAFLIESGATVDAADPAGRTPLHRAVDRDDLEMVGVLVDAGADPERADSSGSTPLAEATAMEREALAQRLRSPRRRSAPP